jgi:hypothetical protein
MLTDVAQSGRLANRASVWKAAYANPRPEEDLDASMSREIFSWYVSTYFCVFLSMRPRSYKIFGYAPLLSMYGSSASSQTTLQTS